MENSVIEDNWEKVLHDRTLMAENGLLIIDAIRDASDKSIKYAPIIITRGLLFEDNSENLLNKIRNLITETINSNTNQDIQGISNTIRSVVRSHFRKELGRDPVVEPVIRDM